MVTVGPSPCASIYKFVLEFFLIFRIKDHKPADVPLLHCRVFQPLSHDLTQIVEEGAGLRFHIHDRVNNWKDTLIDQRKTTRVGGEGITCQPIQQGKRARTVTHREAEYLDLKRKRG